MTDPLTLAIAAAAAGKAVELTGQPVKDAIAELYQRVRGRFRAQAADEVLSGAVAHFDEDERIVRLSETLRDAMDDDPAFADELRSAMRRTLDEDASFHAEVRNRFRQVQVNATARDNAATFVVNEPAGDVVQIRDVHGGLHINH